MPRCGSGSDFFERSNTSIARYQYYSTVILSISTKIGSATDCVGTRMANKNPEKASFSPHTVYLPAM